MTPDQAAALQNIYAKTRLTWHIAGYLVDSDPRVLYDFTSASLANYRWPHDEERILKHMLTLLWAIQEHHDQLRKLVEPLVAGHQKKSSEGN